MGIIPISPQPIFLDELRWDRCILYSKSPVSIDEVRGCFRFVGMAGNETGGFGNKTHLPHLIQTEKYTCATLFADRLHTSLQQRLGQG